MSIPSVGDGKCQFPYDYCQPTGLNRSSSLSLTVEDLEKGQVPTACSTIPDETLSKDASHRLPLSSRFRTITPSDRDRIQALHEEWFPVTYQKEFYDHLVLGKMMSTTGDDLYTKVVCDERDEVIACLVGAHVSANRLNPVSRELLVPNARHHSRLFYIMTLGTVAEYRNEGLATELVQQVTRDVVLDDPSCGALYLHVITLNHAAIRFYERLGFWRVQEIPDYYIIDGRKYSCYLYAKYFHGNRGHLDIYKLVSWFFSSMWQHIKLPWWFVWSKLSRVGISG